MKKALGIVLALAIISLAGLTVAGTVLADEPEAPATPYAQGPLGRAWGGLRRGVGAVIDVVSDLLGLTPEEILAERQEGKTLAEIAQEQGVTEEALIEAIVAKQTEMIEQAVEEGKLTREQADWLIAREKALAPFQITNPFAPRQFRGPRGGRMGGGMGFGPRLQNLCPCPTATPEGTSS